MRKFGVQDMGSQAGKYAVITGANSGLGYETARALAWLGANVTIVCRNKESGQQAVERIRYQTNGKNILLKLADLEDLNEVRSVAAEISEELPRLDVLINNAGIMNVAERTITPYGLEKQMAVNHFAPFVLTNLLLQAMRKAPRPRAVAVASMAAYYADFSLDNINAGQKYTPHGVYCTTKLANILFANELGRREPWLTSVIAHPGLVHTHIQRNMPQPIKGCFEAIQQTFGQSISEGAKAILIAATIPHAKSTMYFGPRNLMKGPVCLVKQPKTAQDKLLAKRFWDLSEELSSLIKNPLKSVK